MRSHAPSRRPEAQGDHERLGGEGDVVIVQWHGRAALLEVDAEIVFSATAVDVIALAAGADASMAEAAARREPPRGRATWRR